MDTMKCRICGKGVLEIGGYLTRVNEKGVPGIWECRPMCGADLPQDTKLMLAITGEDESPNAKLTIGGTLHQKRSKQHGTN